MSGIRHQLRNRPGRDQAAPPLMACHHCDLVLEEVEAADGMAISCPRCGSRLRNVRKNTVAEVLAASFSGLLFYIPAVFQPLLTLDAMGITDSGSLLESFLTLYDYGYFTVSFLVLLGAIIFPLFKLLVFFTTSFCLYFGIKTPLVPWLLRTIHALNEWAMLDIYLLAILVTLIKVHSLATVRFELGLFCFVGLTLASVVATVCLDVDGFWEEAERLRPVSLPPEQVPRLSGRHGKRRISAMEAGLVLCHECRFLVRRDASGGPGCCPRCGAPLHERMPESVARTTALVVTSVLLLFPANLLPMMRVDFLGVPDESTIMDGIIYFFHEGSYFVGGVILTASVLVPLFKVVGLAIILITLRRKKRLWPRHKTIMFRFIEFIGRWSMLDIFVVALMQALVDFGVLTRITASPASLYFALAVVCTMLAASFFDSRLIWDRPDRMTMAEHDGADQAASMNTSPQLPASNG